MNRFNIEVDIVLESIIWSIPILWALHLRRSLVRWRSFFPFHQWTARIFYKVVKYRQRFVLKDFWIVIVLIRVMNNQFFYGPTMRCLIWLLKVWAIFVKGPLLSWVRATLVWKLIIKSVQLLKLIRWIRWWFFLLFYNTLRWKFSLAMPRSPC
jgi:hypothetical protein